MLIWKESLPEDTWELLKVDLPFSNTEDARNHILKVDTQGARPVMWFQADNDSDGEIGDKQSFVIQGIGTGHPYTDGSWRKIINQDSYIGTASLFGNSLILHYFIILEEDYRRALKERK